MIQEIKREKIENFIITFTVVVILVCMFFLAWFIITRPASAKEVQHGQALDFAIAQQPSEKELRKSVNN